MSNKETVAAILSSHSNWNQTASIVEMSKVNPEIRSSHSFYPTFLRSPLRFVLRGRPSKSTRIVIYTDKLQINTEFVKKAKRLTCSDELESRNIPYHIYHHSSASNACLQVADYCAYAVLRKWEFGDTRLYNIMSDRLACTEMDILRNGLRTYYTHESG